MTTTLYGLRFSGDVAHALAQHQVELFRSFGLVSALALPPLIHLAVLRSANEADDLTPHTLDTLRRQYTVKVQAADFAEPAQDVVGARCNTAAVTELSAALIDAIAQEDTQRAVVVPQLVLAWEQHQLASRSAVARIAAAVPTTEALWLTRFVVHSRADDWALDCSWQIEYSRRLRATRRQRDSDRRS